MLRIACERCHRTGDVKNARQYIGRAIKNYQKAKEKNAHFDLKNYSNTLFRQANLFKQEGKLNEALKLLQEAQKILKKLGDQRSRAVTLGDIARIKVSRGEVDEALRLHQE
ncbi:CRISPR type I-D/CYANO-associated protein Csc1, partial [Candidatus Magnetomorum sp. HK-1]